MCSGSGAAYQNQTDLVRVEAEGTVNIPMPLSLEPVASDPVGTIKAGHAIQ